MLRYSPSNIYPNTMCQTKDFSYLELETLQTILWSFNTDYHVNTEHHRNNYIKPNTERILYIGTTPK